jgi:ribosome-associated protein|tara:strand:+ start:249 stop:587 length:339 start_codon:yes stop_codon:yes gene_type:complete
MIETKTNSLTLALSVLDDMKAQSINNIDVTELTSISDHMIFCTGTSSRHARSIVDKISEKAKRSKHPILGIEGYDSAQWILIDLGEVIVHVMLDEVRAFYKLDDLWSIGASA